MQNHTIDTHMANTACYEWHLAYISRVFCA